MPSPLGPPRLSIRDPATTLEEPEAARLRFRQFCYEEVTGPREALVQLRELCRRWLQPESCSKEQMLDLLVLEQFLCVLPPEIQAWVRAKRPGSPEEAATLVEGLQSDPGQLLNWITAHILKPKMPPVLQKTEAASDSCHILVTAESSEQGHGAEPQDVKMEGSAQLSCSVKEEPSADGQEMASPSPALPAQALEGQLAHQEPASTSFHPQRIQEEWELLDSSQKELYWDVMLEKYGTVVSQGLPTPGLEALTESEPRPEQETPILGPEVHRSHMPGMGATVAPRLEGRNSCKDPPGLSLAPLPPETPAAPTPHKPYTCEQCGLSFDWKSVFVIHNRTHTKGPGPERPPKVPEEPPMRCSTSPQNYTCQDCGRSFSWKSQLVIHRKSHVGKRRHVCGDCGCSFDWKSQLVIHRKSHRQEVP